MKRITILLLLIMCTFALEAKVKSTAFIEPPQIAVDNMPTFKKGDFSQFKMWLVKSIHNSYTKNKSNRSGEVTVQFIIEKKGDVSTINITETTHDELSKLVLEEIYKVPSRFSAATKDGEAVRFKTSITVGFESKVIKSEDVSYESREVTFDPIVDMPSSSWSNNNLIKVTTNGTRNYKEISTYSRVYIKE